MKARNGKKHSLEIFLSEFASVHYDAVAWRQNPKTKRAVAEIKVLSENRHSLIRPSMAFKMENGEAAARGGRIESVKTRNGSLFLHCQIE